jgi:hypothetical protein
MSETTSDNWDDSIQYHTRQVELRSNRTENTEQPTRKRRSVSFAKNFDVKEVPHLRDVTPEELQAAWYTAEDFDKIKKSMIVTIRLMMAGKPIGHHQCVRGLEFRTPSGAKTRKQNKLNALTAVWTEQVSQWNENKTDEFAISFVYQQQSQKCREQARRFGCHDEKAVQGSDGFGDSIGNMLPLDGAENPIHVGPLSKKVSPAAA